MKIALVFPPFYLEPMYNLPPLGLANLATALKRTPHRTCLIDFPLSIRKNAVKMGANIYDECVDRVMDEDPDVVGISVQCTTHPAAIQMAKRLKERKPDIRVVFGGHGTASIDEWVLSRYPWVDAIVRGEGELTFPELIGSFEGGLEGEGVAGVTCRKGDRIIRNQDRGLIENLDDLPLTDYSFLPSFEEYRDSCNIRRSIAILEVGRGCPHKCIYCSQAVMWKRQTRTFSVDRLITEMKHLRREFRAECFLLAYDQFTAKRRFVEEFCQEVIAAGLNHVPWYCISRLDSVDASLLKMMREAGCESMCYGIDSGSKRTLAFIRKQIDREILYERVKETTSQGIVPTLSFVVGFPEEEKNDIDATLELALRTGILGNINPLVQLATILPGTELHLKYGDRLVREVDTYFSLGIEFDGGKRLPMDEAMIGADPSTFCSFYNLPCPGRSLTELNIIANFFYLIVNYYPRSFLLLAQESQESILDFFFEWLNWLEGRHGYDGSQFSPRDLYLHFSDFADEILRRRDHVLRTHIPEVVRYETMALEVGKRTVQNNHFHINLGNAADFKPIQSEAVLVGEFGYNVAQIIADLKGGDFRASYPGEQTFLVFLQEGDQLRVIEINEFGRNFLQLCDGRNTLRTICDQLTCQFGTEMSKAEFFKSCVEAVEQLGQMKMLQSNQP